MASDKSKNRRINFEVTDELYDVIEELTSATRSTSKAEFLRKSIALMKVAAEAKQKNEKIIISDSDRKPITELVLW